MQLTAYSQTYSPRCRHSSVLCAAIESKVKISKNLTCSNQFRAWSKHIEKRTLNINFFSHHIISWSQSRNLYFYEKDGSPILMRIKVRNSFCRIICGPSCREFNKIDVQYLFRQIYNYCVCDKLVNCVYLGCLIKSISYSSGTVCQTSMNKIPLIQSFHELVRFQLYDREIRVWHDNCMTIFWKSYDHFENAFKERPLTTIPMIIIILQ